MDYGIITFGHTFLYGHISFCSLVPQSGLIQTESDLISGQVITQFQITQMLQHGREHVGFFFIKPHIHFSNPVLEVEKHQKVRSPLATTCKIELNSIKCFEKINTLSERKKYTYLTSQFLPAMPSRECHYLPFSKNLGS